MAPIHSPDPPARTDSTHSRDAQEPSKAPEPAAGDHDAGAARPSSAVGNGDASSGSPGAEAAPQGREAGRVVLDSESVARVSRRIAHEILERNASLDRVALVAIAAGGVPLGQMIVEHLENLRPPAPSLGELDVTLYRDDVIGRGKRPVPQRTRMPATVAGLRVVLIDDVVFTGRTIRAAMDALIDFGRPEAIQVACLVDRGHRELPIQVDFVGKNIPTKREEEVVLQALGAGRYEVRVR